MSNATMYILDHIKKSKVFFILRVYSTMVGDIDISIYNKDMEQEHVKFELIDLDYNNGRLSFKIKRITSRRVPIRYQTINYERFPVEWKDSIRTAVELTYNKAINVERFCETELKTLNIPKKFKYEIADFLNYFPTWMQKQHDLDQKNNELAHLKSSIKPHVSLDGSLKPIKSEWNRKIDALNAERKNIKINQSSKKSIILRSILTIPTLGLSWVGFVSKNKAKKNTDLFLSLGEEIYKTNVLFKEKIINKTKEVNLLNLNIDKHNSYIYEKIKIIQNEITLIQNKNYQFKVEEDGFINLRDRLKTITRFNAKGVYVIWNKTKDKYYVGQSKDVYKRLFTQHFNNGDVKNIIFAKDWYNGDEFFYKVIQLETKDELDAKEKELIEKYNSFRSGYNGTGGNY